MMMSLQSVKKFVSFMIKAKTLNMLYGNLHTMLSPVMWSSQKKDVLRSSEGE